MNLQRSEYRGMVKLQQDEDSTEDYGYRVAHNK